MEAHVSIENLNSCLLKDEDYKLYELIKYLYLFLFLEFAQRLEKYREISHPCNSVCDCSSCLTVSYLQISENKKILGKI